MATVVAGGRSAVVLRFKNITGILSYLKVMVPLTVSV